MAEYELLLPKMGESVAEATIIKWVKKPGDVIVIDDAVVEIATDKVDSDVPSPVSGKLKKQVCQENDVVQVGDIIAIIETEDETAKPDIAVSNEDTAIQEDKYPATPEVSVVENYQEEDIPGISQINESVDPDNYRERADTTANSTRFYSPLVRSIAAKEGVSAEELEQIKGTGLEGRITKEDILAYIKSPGSKDTFKVKKKSDTHVREYPETKKPGQSNWKSGMPETASANLVSGGDEIIEMDRMRRLIAEHMVMSKHTSPHVTSFVEADVTNIVQWRERIKNVFEKREGEKITFTPIFIEAAIKAIRDFPMINVFVNGTQIIKKRDINIGMATALPSGNLIVPVIKNAGQLNLVGIVKSVNDLSNRARNGKLLPDEVQDGTFTVTNIGSFGNTMGTPIINQPQVAVLAFGVIKKKPAVIESPSGDMIGIRHMMFLSLSYDHRVVDGALGGSFIKRVADYLEGWDMELEV